MRSPTAHPCRTFLHALAFMSTFHYGHALTQTYCSSENTGSDYSVVTDIYQSNGLCHDNCDSDYAFAIVQYQSCWCSNYIPADTVDTSECSTACPGYPAESCGNDDKGLYGYIALDKSPSGTAGGSSSSASSTQASSSQSSTSSPQSSSQQTSSSSAPSVSTVYSSVSVTVSQTLSQSPSVIVSYVTLSPTQSSTSSSTSTTPSSTPSSTTSSSSTSSSIPLTTTSEAAAVSTPTTGSSWTRTTVVSTEVLIISGAPVTKTVTSTPMVVKPDLEDSKSKSSVSGGTIAGAVIGSLVGVALVLAGAFFLWRRRRTAASDGGSTTSSNRRKMERNTSVLSKTGLLSSGMAGSGNDVEKSYAMPPALITANNRHSAMFDPNGHSPTSPNENGSQASRRNSRPLLFDQRLNPHAIMSSWEANGSRTSVGTMQDQRDYSRPLGVTNPDPIED